MNTGERFAKLQAALNQDLVERQVEIHLALVALVSGSTYFMVGDPGIAKTFLADRLAGYIDGGEFFTTALDRFATPEDIFGPRDIKAMKAGRWERVVDGTLATANWAMLDEFFEGSSALLKSLLRAMNERTYRQGTATVAMPLTTLFAASNVIPTDPRFANIYDRLLIRRELHRIHDRLNFVRMLDLDLTPPTPILSWSDVTDAQAECRRMPMSTELLGAVGEIRTKLIDAGIVPSDRRFKDAINVIRAQALLDECEMVEPEHLRVLEHVLWHEPAQFAQVAAVIAEVVDPLSSEVDELLRVIEEIRSQVRPVSDELDRKELANELHDKTVRAERDLEGLQRRSDQSPRQVALIEQADRELQDLSLLILSELWNFDEAEIARRKGRRLSD